MKSVHFVITEIKNKIPVILLFLLIGLSLIVDEDIPYNFFTFRETFLLIISGLLALFYFKGKHINKIDWFVFIYILYNILNIIVFSSLIQATAKNIAVFISLLIIFIQVRNGCNLGLFTKRRIIACMFLVYFIHILIAIAQYYNFYPSFHSYFVITGTFFNPGPFTILCGSFSVFFLCYGLSVQNIKIKLIIVLLNLVTLFIIFLSLSRTAIISYTVCVFLIYLFSAKDKISFKKQLNLYITLFCSSIFITFLGFLLFIVKIDSAYGRFLTWHIAYDIIEDYPLFGIGINNYSTYHLKYQGAYFLKWKDANFIDFKNIAGDIRFAFNDYLQVFCETGFIGFCLFIVVLVFFFKCKPKKQQNKWLVLSIKIFVAFFLVSSFFSYPLSLIEFKVLLMISIGALSGFQKEDGNFIINNVRIRFLKRISMKILGVILIIFGIVRWNYLSEFPHQSNSSKDLLKFYFLIADNPSYLMTLSNLYILEGNYKKSIVTLTILKSLTPDKKVYYALANSYKKNRNYAKAIENYSVISRGIPNLLMPKLELAKLYLKTKDYVLFEATVSELIETKSKGNLNTSIKIKSEAKKLLDEYKKIRK